MPCACAAAQHGMGVRTAVELGGLGGHGGHGAEGRAAPVALHRVQAGGRVADAAHVGAGAAGGRVARGAAQAVAVLGARRAVRLPGLRPGTAF